MGSKEQAEIRLSISTQFPSRNGIERKWHVLDANDAAPGKIATRAARLLMGKHKPSLPLFLDTSDHVIVINAEKVKLTGNKEQKKIFRYFTGYPGGLVEMGVRRVHPG